MPVLLIGLAGEHDRCTCVDVEHNLESASGASTPDKTEFEFGSDV